MHSQSLRAAVAALMVVILAGCTFAAPLGSSGPSGAVPVTSSGPNQPDRTPAPARTPRPRGTATADITPAPTPRATGTPTPAPTEPAEIPGLEDLLGSDGRFTMLLMGVDSRTAKISGRTDTIMFVTIDPNTGRVAMASLPRDMVAVPIGPGKTFGRGYTRINALFGTLSAQFGRQKAFSKMVQAMEYMSGIEIDRYAMIGFSGVQHLIDTIGGVTVNMPFAVLDKHIHIHANGQEGLRLKKGKNKLNGVEALGFARIRHVDSDYARARRQQQLVAAAAQRVLKKGDSILGPLAREAFEGKVKTDLKPADVPALFALAQRAKLGTFKSTVLGPTTYGGQAPNDVQYATSLNMPAVRKYFAKVFGPIN